MGTEYRNFRESIKLPTIDYGKSLSNRDVRAVEAQKLVDAFSEVGFCMLSNIPDYDKKAVFEAVKWFYKETSSEERFNQLATKSFNKKNDNIYRGIFPVIPGKLSHKEGYDMGHLDFGNETSDERKERLKNPLFGDTPRISFPDEPERQKQADKFYQVMEKHFKIVETAAKTLMSMIAECGGEPSNFFAEMFEPMSNNTFRTIMYPYRDTEDIPKAAFLPDGRTISTPAHQDSGVLTLLQTFGYVGLELELDGVWYSVPPQEDALVVNVGELLSSMSNNRFKATIHRVLDIGEDRFSNPFFFEPKLDANIGSKIPEKLLWSKKCVNGLNPGEFHSYGSFLLNKLPIYTEWDYLIANLPKFMIDKYLKSRIKKIDCWATKKGIEIDGMSYDSAGKE